MSCNGNQMVLVLGGARSGKSMCAEQLVASSGYPVVYIATATAGDDEMRERIRRHQHRRPAGWQTREAPFDVPAVLDRVAPEAVLIDCLTMYISNWLLRHEQNGLAGDELADAVLAEVDKLLACAARKPGLVVVVANEVGQGIVPSYPIGRAFRDIAGWANQRAAAAADQVYYCIAGIPVELKALQAVIGKTSGRFSPDRQRKNIK